MPLDEDGARKVLRLIDALEDLDDVQNVYANFDVSDEVLEAVELDRARRHRATSTVEVRAATNRSCAGRLAAPVGRVVAAGVDATGRGRRQRGPQVAGDRRETVAVAAVDRAACAPASRAACPKIE